LNGHRHEVGLVPARAQLRDESSAKISAPPRANGTCGAQTAILILPPRATGPA
jgi:hypothetical protein